MLAKIFMLFISAICLTVLFYWAYTYATDAPKITGIERGTVVSHEGKEGFVKLKSGAVIEPKTHDIAEGTEVQVTVRKARRAGNITYSISKSSKILIAVDSESVNEDGNWRSKDQKGQSH